MTTARESLKQSVVGLASDAMSVPVTPYGGPGSTQAQAIASCRNAVKRRRTVAWFTDGGTAGTASLETAVAFCDQAAEAGWQVIGVDICIPVAVTANNSNYATFTLNKRTSGGAAVPIAQNTTQITDGVLGANAVAYQRYAMTLNATAANALVATGTDVLTLALTKTGTGVAVGQATGAGVMISVELEEL